MNLLKYEFVEAKQGSYNHTLSELVKMVRFYTTAVSVTEFQLALPLLQSMEKGLQKSDLELGKEEERNYIAEIMDELEQEQSMEAKLLGEIERLSKVIMEEYYNEKFSMTDLSIEFINKCAVYRLEFNGFKEADIYKSNILKEIARAMCYKFGVVFMDKSKDMLI